MLVTDRQRSELKKYIADIDRIILHGDVQSLLDVIDEAIIDNMLTNNDEPDEEGIKLQKIYDEIFEQN